MIHYKTPQEIASMKKGGSILADVMHIVLDAAKPGISELELNDLAEKLIRKKGAEPGFERVPGWHHAICVSTNDTIVHGIPTAYTLQEGDIVGIDCGVIVDDLNTDMSETVRIQNGKSIYYTGDVNKGKDTIDQFLETGKKALHEAIGIVKPGNRIGHISKIIQDIVEKGGGYSIVRNLVGHGVGRQLHEEPEIPGYLARPIEKTLLLKPNMTIAIEVIYNMGAKEIQYTDDGWTIKTKDGSLSGLFERTVAVTKSGYEVLT